MCIRDRICSTIAGFTSFCVHAGGTPVSIYMLPLRMKKEIYVGTRIIFFTFVNIKNVPIFFANGDGDLHWLHGYFVSFLASIIVMLMIGKLYPKTPEEISDSESKEIAPVDMTPWLHAKNVSYGIMGCTVGIYLMLTVLSS